MKVKPQGYGDHAHVVFETDDGTWIATVKAEFAKTFEESIAASANRSNTDESKAVPR